MTVRNYSGRFILDVQGKTTFISPTYVTEETAGAGVSDERGRQQSFTQQAAPNELELGEGG